MRKLVDALDALFALANRVAASPTAMAWERLAKEVAKAEKDAGKR